MKSSVFSDSLKEGTTVLHYRIIRKIGAGAVGVVYHAHDTLSNRQVVLKFLRGDLEGDSESRERFQREAHALSVLDHPTITSFLGLEHSEEGDFLVIEYIAGRTLRDLLNEEPRLGLEKTTTIIDRILDALIGAHSRQIIHRDVKPSNIIIGNDGNIKLTDFGIAVIGDRTRLTLTGQMIGTPYYMSPEQAMGRRIDTRTDIFSVGSVMYEMIHGRRPFNGDNPVSLIYSIINEQPEYPVIDDDPKIRAMCRIADKAMMKDPDDRYQSASEMRQDTGKILDTMRGTHDGPLDKVGTIVERSSSTGRFTRFFTGRKIALIPIFVAIIIPILISEIFFEGDASNPVRYDLFQNVLRVLNEDGSEIWSREFPFQLDYIEELPPERRKDLMRIVDLDGDGRNELLLSVFSDSLKNICNTLVCYSSDGAEKWRFVAGRDIAFGSGAERTRGLFNIKSIDVHDFTRDGTKQVVVLSHQKVYYPAQLVLIGHEGDVLGEYWNSGFLYYKNYLDIDGDGIDEILAGGTNNEYRRACFVVLDPLTMSGTSPQEEEEYKARELTEEGTEMYYILFERTDVAESAGLASQVNEIKIVDDNINLVLAENQSSGLWETTSYEIILSNELHLLDIIFESSFIGPQYWAYKRGLISGNVHGSSYRERLKEKLGRIEYWGGDGWTKKPSVNSSWLKARPSSRTTSIPQRL